MTNVEMEAERLASYAVTLLSASAAESSTMALSRQISGFLAVNGSSLPEWRRYELETAVAQLDPYKRAGDAERPNVFTTSKATQQDDSYASEIFSARTLDEIGKNAQTALGKIGEGFTKGLAASALKIGVGVSVLIGAYFLAKKRGWI